MEEAVKIVPNAEFHVLPIVQARTLYLSTIERKTHRLDHMQKRPGGETGATDVAGIPMNFRPNQHHVAFTAFVTYSVHNTPTIDAVISDASAPPSMVLNPSSTIVVRCVGASDVSAPIWTAIDAKFANPHNA